MVDFKIEDSVPDVNGGTRRRGPGRPPGPSKTTTKVVPNVIPEKELRDALIQNLSFMGLAVSMFDTPCNQYKADDPEHTTCTEAVMGNAESIADALVEASKKNPAIRRVLNMMVTGGVFGQVVFAFMPVIVTVARNHIPALQVEGPTVA